MSTIDLSAFHEYDIRGIYPTEINEDFYYKLGKSLATYVGKGPIAVGYDVRLSSPSLSKQMRRGIIDCGVDVVDLGQISTEIHYFAMGKHQFEASVMITASHNPGQYNGAKIVKKGIKALHGSYGLPEIKEMMNQDIKNASQHGSVTPMDVFHEWIEYASHMIDTSRLKEITVVVDAGNGATGQTWQEMIKKLPIKIIPMYLEPDGRFPNHVPDPLKPENIKPLQDMVVETKADLGIAFDGDGDRAFFVDNDGVFVSGTVSGALFSNYLLQKQKGAYLYTAICGRIVPETIEKNGGQAIKTPVGHSIIKTMMKEHDGVFACEHSGHFYFKSNYHAESSLLAALTMFEILSQTDKTMSELRQEYDIYPQSGEINFIAEDPNAIIEGLKKEYSDDKPVIETFEGTSFWFDTFWFNIRQSKTEPLIRLNLEANSHNILDYQRERVITIITQYGGVRK